MKILHIIPTYKPAYSRGGPIWSVHNFNKSIAERGHDITVYTTDIDIPKGKVPLEKEVNIDGLNVVYFPDSYPNLWKYKKVGFLPYFFPRHWEYSKEMFETLDENIKDFDLVHITSTFLSVSTLGSYYAKKHNIPYIISPRGNLMTKPVKDHGYLRKGLYISLLEERNLKRANAVHFTVEKEEQEYLELGLDYKDKIMIPNGIDPNEFEEGYSEEKFREKYDIPKDKKIVLFLGRLGWIKGFDTLIPAFKEVIKKDPNTVLVLAGGDDESYKKKIEEMIQKENIESNVIFTGMITGADKTTAFQTADLFVLPSYSENFGMAVVEAMYFELPVIITRNIGIAEEVRQNNAGFVIRKDKDELARNILEVFDKMPFAKETAKRGKKLVEERFVMDKIADKWIKAYSDIIEKSKNKDTYEQETSDNSYNTHL